MRRSPLVITATAAGIAGVLAFDPHTAAVRTATAARTATASPVPTTTRTTSSTGTRTATGDAVDTQYGAAQVRVSVRDGKIVKLEALELPGGEPRSVENSSSAAPFLEQEVLAGQSAAIDAVSGATFTSASYAQSVQSALDKLGFKAADGSRATLQVPQGGH